MTSEDIFKESFPQYTQVGGNHYTKFPIQPYEFISKNDLSFFQGNVVKYVCRYQRKGGVEDLKKIVHYCQLEMLKINDMKKEKIMPRKNYKRKTITVNKHKFYLEIYNNLIDWEIFPYNHDAALYAFSNKDRLNKIVTKKYILEK